MLNFCDSKLEDVVAVENREVDSSDMVRGSNEIYVLRMRSVAANAVFFIPPGGGHGEARERWWH